MSSNIVPFPPQNQSDMLDAYRAEAADVDALFGAKAENQYTRSLLFFTVVALMSRVVHRIRTSLHAAYQSSRHRRIEVSVSVAVGVERNPMNSLDNWYDIVLAVRSLTLSPRSGKVRLLQASATRRLPRRHT